MKDRDTGEKTPERGGSSESSVLSKAPPHSGGRHKSALARPVATGGAGAAASNGQPRKRRKRRRGRKVYARDGQSATAPQQPESRVSDAKNAPPDGGDSGAGQANKRRLTPPDFTRHTPVRERPAFAALDLGTNNCRLLVAVPTRYGQFRVIDAFSRIVRLGEGLSSNGRLGEKAMDRAVEALIICAEKLRSRNVRRARLIATEACRSAANGAQFLERVSQEAGLKLEIIDRQTEARLAVSGCGSLIERDTKGLVLFDIGGGSSEIALIDLSHGRRSRHLANHIVSWTSLPVGVVSLAERFGGRIVTPEIFAAMVDDVSMMLTSFDGRDKLDHILESPGFHLLGTSGTVTTLAGVHLELPRYERRRVDGLWMDRDSVNRMIAKLVGWDYQSRVENPCIGADRADLVLAGCAILEAIRAVWPSQRLRVADRGLREGILSELMAEEGVWRHSSRNRSWR
ncbi:Ppx/GppA phosphatase family protein [Aquamicrobium segne]|uniref:Ppx/GppA phosphatase family protein n=1 Tax=Aquamicrobium segne TaxID=469547 RepID=A0ABW0GX84_9HYPH